MNGIVKLAVLVVAVAVLAGVPAFATTVTYTTLLSFQAATSGATTANFDGDVAGTPIVNGDVVDGITFTSVIGGGKVFEIQTGFATTSGANYLGTNDASTGALLGSDSITMSFGSPTTALGLYILGGNALTAGTFTLDIGSGTALNSATEDSILFDGTYAYFLGITSDTPFSSATLSPTVLGGVGQGTTWNVDDITTATANGGNQPPPPVPEPGTLVLMATGLGALVRRVRKA